MATFPRYTRESAPVTGVTNPNAGAAHEQLARTLDEFSARRVQDLNQGLQELGYQQGLQAGAKGDAGDATPHGIRARAFREGALLSHQAAVQTDIRDSVAQFQIDAKDDPDLFDAKVDGLKEGLLQEADPTMQLFINQRLADYAGRAKISVIEAQQTRLQKEAADDLEKGAQGFFDDATTAAFEGNHPMVEARRQELDQLLERGDKAQLITPAKAAELRSKFTRETTSQEVVGSFDRLLREKGSDAANKSIERWQATKPSEMGLTVDDHEAVTRQLIAQKNRFDALKADEAFKRTAAFRAELSVRQTRVNDAISVMKDGFSPAPETMKTITEDLAWLKQSPDPVDQVKAVELGRDFDVAAAIQGQAAKFRLMPQAQREAELQRLESSLRGKGATADQVALLTSLKQVSSKIDTDLKQDPRGYAVANNLLQDAPLDLSSAESLQQSLAARATNSQLGNQLTGKPVPLMTRAEANQLATVYNTSEIEQKVSLLGLLTAGAGDRKTAEATLSQLDKQGNKGMALLGDFVMRGRGELAREVMRGQALVAGDKSIIPTRTNYQPDLDDVWAGAMQDWPDQRGQYLDAAVAKYAELKARKGDVSDAYDAKAFRQALGAVMPTARFNGRRVAIPANASEDTFDAWTDSWTDADFIGVPAGAQTGMADLVRDRGRLVELGNGRYGVALSSASAEAERYLLNDSGQPFVLQFPGAK